MTSLAVRSLPITLALLMAPLAAAQSTPAATPVQQGVSLPAPPALTLAQALGALQRSPGWQSAALQYLSAGQNLDAARARAGLSLSAGVDLSAARTPLAGEWSGGGTLNVQAAVNALPWSPAQGSVRQAARRLYRAGLERRDSQNALAFSTVQNYLGVQQAARALALARQLLLLDQRRLEVARAELQAGVRTQEALLAVQATGEQDAAALAEAGSRLDTAARQFYTTLGMVPDPASLTAPNFGSRPLVSDAVTPLADLLARAAQGRSEVLKAASNLQDAQAALEAARLDRALPGLNLSVQYGQLASGTAASGNLLSGGLNVKTGQLTAGASVPLKQSAGTDSQGGAGGTTARPTSLALGLTGTVALLDPAGDAAVRSAQTSVSAARLSLASARTSVDLDVRQKYADRQNALLARAAPRTLLARARTALASEQARQQSGLSTSLDVQGAELNVQGAQNALDQAENTAYLATLTLSVAAAGFSPSMIAFRDPPSPQAQDTAHPGGQP